MLRYFCNDYRVASACVRSGGVVSRNRLLCYTGRRSSSSRTKLAVDNARPRTESGTSVSGGKVGGPGGGQAARPSLADALSKWLWRGVFLVAGAGCAGAGAMYATDPEGTREMAQAAREDIEARIRFFTEPSRDKLLPDPVSSFPGAPPLRTLVLDLETLVHSSYSRQFGWRVAKRPGVDAFLAYMSTYYEIVVFTSNLNMYADPILNQLDPNKYYVSYRLYRPETKYEAGAHIKELSHLNRDLARVVLVDDDPKHFKYQPENAILLTKWSDDPGDTALLDLIPFLEGLVQEDVQDIREGIRSLRGKPLRDGLAEYEALASARSNRVAQSRGGLFGPPSVAAQSSPPPGQGSGAAGDVENAEDMHGESDGNGRPASLWGQVSSKSSTLFRPA